MVFQAGDRVEMVNPEICDWKMRLVEGTHGTVLAIERHHIGVEWDIDIDGHSLNGMCERGYGWWVPSESCKPYADNEDLFALHGV